MVGSLLQRQFYVVNSLVVFTTSGFPCMVTARLARNTLFYYAQVFHAFCVYRNILSLVKNASSCSSHASFFFLHRNFSGGWRFWVYFSASGFVGVVWLSSACFGTSMLGAPAVFSASAVFACLARCECLFLGIGIPASRKGSRSLARASCSRKPCCI